MKADYGIFSNVPKTPIPNIDNQPSLLAVRVTDIILTEERLISGSWDSIGTIYYDPFFGQIQNKQNPNNFAKPFFPNIKNYPLIGELVYIIDLPDPTESDDPQFIGKYYLNPINIWNSPHHNAFPINLPDDVKLDYKEIENNGLVKQEISESNSFSFGNTFVEKGNIKPLLPDEGDVIFEGRFGQSIRFGSDESGSAITKIRNGQKSGSKEGWIPTQEDIDGDASSVYLTDGQVVSLKEYPNQYKGKQVVISSGRLLFNSKDDDILMFSKGSINLSGGKEFNVITKDKTVIDSSKIYLGKDAVEPLLLGTKVVNLLQELLSKLNKLATAINTMPTNINGIQVITPEVLNESGDLKKSTELLLTQLNQVTSSVNYTK